MTEADWDDAAEPQPLLQHLRDRGWASDRKLRLFCCACVRRVWELLPDERLRAAVEASEGFADRRVDAGQLAVAHMAARLAFHAARRAEWEAEAQARFGSTPAYDATSAGLFAAAAAFALTSPASDEGVDILDAHGWPPAGEGGPERERHPRPAHRWAASAAGRARRWRGPKAPGDAVVEPGHDGGLDGRAEAEAGEREEVKEQAALLRDLFHPFHPLQLDPSWLTPAVASLARASYEHRVLPAGQLDRSRLLVLADALLDAGADDAALLQHLRGEGPHWRGCWAVDAVLGKG